MRRAFALLAAVCLAGCGVLGGGGTTYPVSAREARAQLLLTEPPLYLFGNEVAKARVSRDGDGTVRWLLVDRLGTGMLALVARSEEAGADRTRVSVSVEAPPGGRHDEVARRLEENPAIANFFRAAMAEQIDATFEKREFDMAAIQGEMVVAMLTLAGRDERELVVQVVGLLDDPHHSTRVAESVPGGAERDRQQLGCAPGERHLTGAGRQAARHRPGPTVVLAGIGHGSRVDGRDAAGNRDRLVLDHPDWADALRDGGHISGELRIRTREHEGRA